MTFYLQGLTSHELMPVLRLFNKKTVERTHKTDQKHRIDDSTDLTSINKPVALSGAAIQTYHDINHLPQGNPILIASQIMSSSVTTLKPENSIVNAIKLFKEKNLRHIPIVTDSERVVGILSDRDVLHYISGLTDDYRKTKSRIKSHDEIKQIMKFEVLTASTDTDVRYIARLFVEQRIGAMPIVQEGNLVGIITRSDILNSVMRNFILELWA